PMHALVYGVAHDGGDARYLGKLRVAPRAQESYQSEDQEEGERNGYVAPRASERAWKLAREEVAKALPALRVCLIDAPVRANHKAVQIIYESRVSALCTRNRKV